MDELRATFEDTYWVDKFFEVSGFNEAPPVGLSPVELEDRFWMFRFSEASTSHAASPLTNESPETHASYEEGQAMDELNEDDGLSIRELQDRYWAQQFATTPVSHEAPPVFTRHPLKDMA